MASRYFKLRHEQGVDPTEGVEPGDVSALGYLRLSTKKQEQGQSAAAQDGEIGAYIARHGWEPGPTFRDTQRGTVVSREGYQAILTQVRELRKLGRPVVVVAAALDRTGRDLPELLGRRQELARLRVPLHYTRERGTMSDDEATFKGWMASKEPGKISERVTASKVVVAEAGLPPSGPASWGYVWRLPRDEDEAAKARHKAKDGRDAKGIRRVLDAEPVEAPAVAELFARAATGEAVMSSVRWASALPEAVRGGRRMSQQRLMAVLQNSVYVARYSRDPEVDTPEALLALSPGTWPALTTDDVWLAVQRQLAKRRTLPARPEAPSLLGGLVRCPVDGCGCKMHGGTQRKRYVSLVTGEATTYVSHRYCCSSRVAGRGTCAGTVDAGRLDGATLDTVGALLDAIIAAKSAKGSPLLAAMERVYERLARPANPDQAAVDSLTAEDAKLANRLRLARADLYDGQMTKAEHDETIKPWVERRAQIKRDLERLTEAHDQAAALPPWPEVLARVESWAAELREGTAQEQRAVLLNLVESVTPEVVSKGKGGVVHSIIEWTPLASKLAATVEEVQRAA